MVETANLNLTNLPENVPERAVDQATLLAVRSLEFLTSQARVASDAEMPFSARHVRGTDYGKP